jgi:hypothetical protein
MVRAVFGVLSVFLSLRTNVADRQDPGEKLANRTSPIDKKLLKALEELAIAYDRDGDPEAASFFAEAAVGFGSTDEKVKSIRIGWEVDAYLGKIQEKCGKPLEKTGPIRQKLDGPAGEYKKILEEMERKWLRRKIDQVEVTDGERKIVKEIAVRYAIASRAADSIKTTKRINELRRGMKLRPVLWDFENSTKLILACAFTCESGDPLDADGKNRKSIYFEESLVKFLNEKSANGIGELDKWVEETRSLALVRNTMLNPNARRLWLAHWAPLDGRTGFVAYRIPQEAYRDDIPTPSQRHERGTIVKDWIDTEEVVEIEGRKVPVSRYPFDGETEIPWSFAGPTRGYPAEEGWARSEFESFQKTKAGVPIMVRFFGKAKITNIEAKLAAANSGKEVPLRVYTNGDERVPGLADWPTILLVPEGLLARGATYTVTIRSKLDGVAFERNWSFTTATKK